MQKNLQVFYTAPSVFKNLQACKLHLAKNTIKYGRIANLVTDTWKLSHLSIAKFTARMQQQTRLAEILLCFLYEKWTLTQIQCKRPKKIV